MISTIYAAAARSRRRYYFRRPHLQRRLSRPVLSIGNIAVGGRAKTPLAACVALRLRMLGERPAILSRGYARRSAADGVVVVRDPDGIRADLDRAGDEPLMLARQLHGVAVLASSSRYLAGRLAEHHFGCTVHVLDDGFQHFDLHRDADLVVVARDDLDARTLPSGRLREPADAIAAADALVALRLTSLAHGGRSKPDAELAAMVQGKPVFGAARKIAAPPTSDQVLAVAGIASPESFFEALRENGWNVAGELGFRDHYRYSAGDLARIGARARAAGAAAIVTTEKDLVRLLPFRPFAMAVHAVPVTIEIDDEAAFDGWLQTIVERARA